MQRRPKVKTSLAETRSSQPRNLPRMVLTRERRIYPLPAGSHGDQGRRPPGLPGVVFFGGGALDRLRASHHNLQRLTAQHECSRFNVRLRSFPKLSLVDLLGSHRSVLKRQLSELFHNEQINWILR